MGIPVQFLNRGEARDLFHPLSLHCCLSVMKRTGSPPEKDDPCACLVRRAAGPCVKQGGVPKALRDLILFSKNWHGLEAENTKPP